MKKRLLAMLMALTMMLGLLPETYYAQETNSIVATETEAETATETTAETTTEVNKATEIATEATKGAITETSTEATETATEATTETSNDAAEDATTETATEETANTYKTGLIQPQVKQVEITDTDTDACGTTDSVLAQATADCFKYASNYYYNLMTNEERYFYDSLDTNCYDYITSDMDVPYKGVACLDVLAYPGLTLEEAMDVMKLFRYSNPQYYFLSTECYVGVNGGLALGIYPAFESGTARTAATKDFFNAIKLSVSEITNDISGTVTTEQAIHDWVVNTATYDPNYALLNNKDSNNNQISDFYEYELANGYTQSCYSVFCKSGATTVCAGYTQTFELLCDWFGIDTIAVTSLSHAWNRVRLNGSWYNVDCTWDDFGGKQYYYYNRSYSAVCSCDVQGEHDQLPVYFAYMPDENCSLDSGATADSVGTIAAAAGKVAAPVISIVPSESAVKLSFSSSQPGARIYYTLDGTAPSVSDTFCDRYNEPISVSWSATVRAIAVYDAYDDSDVVETGIYTVKFKSQGGTAVTSQVVAAGGLVTKPKKPTRTGYNFAGWYKDYTCKNLWDFSSDSVMKNVKLYAKWTKIYKITYELNGGIKNKSNPSKYTVESSTITLLSPTFKGYAFDGWYKDYSFTARVTKIKKGSVGNRTLYAKWKKVSVAQGTISSLKNKSGKKMAVTVAKVSGAKGYQIRYSTKSSMKSAKSVKLTSTSTSVTSLAKNKTYYVQVRAYKLDSAGNKIYGSWSSIKAVKIRK